MFSRGGLLLLGLTLIGCAAHERAPTRPVAKAPSEPDVTYVFEPDTTAEPVLRVRLSTTSETAPFRVACDNWAGIDHCETEFRNVEALDSAGHALAVRASNNEWIVDAAPHTRLTLKYTLSPSKREALASDDTIYYPVVADRYVHFIGHRGLLVPREPKKERSIRFEWRGLSERGWRSACSFGIGSIVDVRRSLDDIALSVFIAGDYDLARSADGRGEITFAVRPGTWKFGSSDLIATALPVIAEARAIFGDTASPLLVTATPTSIDANSIHGTALTNSLALFFPRADRLLPASLFGLLLAHEYFHEWNGLMIRPADADDEGTDSVWFTEGFTEFYMRRIAFRAGRIGTTEYTWHLNRALLDYAKNPFKDVSNERIRTDFWKSADIQRLPYLRGQVVALLVDAEMRRSSQNARNLDAMMKTLASRSAEPGVTTESLLDTIRAHTSDAFAVRLRKVVEKGEVPVLPPDILAPCLSLKDSSREEGQGAARHTITFGQFEMAQDSRDCPRVL